MRTIAVVLAAGKSRRMGMPKPFLPYDASRTFAEKITTEFQSFGLKKIVFTANPETSSLFQSLKEKASGFFFVTNFHSEKGRFYSLVCGLESLEFLPDYCFLHNADMPIFNSEVLNALYEKRAEADYVVPRFRGRGGHPVLLNKKILHAAIHSQKHSQHLRDFLSRFKKTYADVSNKGVCFNINSPEDYREFLRCF